MMTKIVWREWYSADLVAVLEKHGTLPRNENCVDTLWMDGGDVAAELAALSNRNDSESFSRGGSIVILEPPEFAGTYHVSVDYEPCFSAHKADSE